MDRGISKGVFIKIAVASATLYYLPFSDVLDIISEAGFRCIELDMYWKGGDWEMAQHLKGIPPHEAVKTIREKGLEIVCIHDTGGVLQSDAQSAINPVLFEYLEAIGEASECLIFHPPHTKTDSGPEWWESYRHTYADELKNIADNSAVCIENIPYFDGYHVPLVSPGQMLEYVSEKNLFVNIDTTHYGQTGVDIINALDILGDRVKSVHLSDYIAGVSHVFPGEGALDLERFIARLPDYDVRVLTLECSLDISRQMSHEQLVGRLKTAGDYVRRIIG